MGLVYDTAAAAGFSDQVHPGKFGQYPAAGDVADAESGGNIICGVKLVPAGAGVVFDLARQFFSYFFPQTAYFLDRHRMISFLLRRLTGYIIKEYL